jgi:hypothetical protein
MTLFRQTDGIVAGQPINPNFGAANGAAAAGNATIQLPAGMPLLVAASLGLVPANALVSTVNGVLVGGAVTPAGIGADPCSVMELLSSGNGNQSNGGVGYGALPTSQGENQQYIVNETAIAMSANGPTPVNVDTLGLAPVAAGVQANLVGLTANGFTG